ncbi:MAG TPA: glycosyltransferase family 4 protein [Waterburya sp.]|jgi:starch synthase
MTSYSANSHSSIERNVVIDRESSLARSRSQPTIALLPFPDLFEDFFDTIGLSLESFGNELTGGWMFNYIDALQLAGVRTVLFFISARVSQTTQFVHAPTGAMVCVLPAPKIYRAYRAVRHQVERLVPSLKGSSSDVCSAGSTNTPSPQSPRRSPQIAFKSGVKSLGSYLSTPLRLLARELRQQECDAILCQEYEFARFDVCVLLGKLMRLPVFATFQGGDRLPSPLEYPLRWLTLRTCTGLIVASQPERQRLQTFYRLGSAQIARIFNPMDATTWGAIDRNQARSALDIPEKAKIVVFHGRIQIWHKGLDILLEAWEQICRERPGQDLRLLLVGTGSDADALRQRIAVMELKGVMWIDEYVRDRNLIQRYLSAADVYTLPSRKEGFPVAPIEAMACGLPVVAADVAGVSDIFEHGEAHGGLVVPREDAHALALELGRVLDDETYRDQLGKNARRRAQECFSFEVIGKQLRDLLLCQNHPQGELLRK